MNIIKQTEQFAYLYFYSKLISFLGQLHIFPFLIYRLSSSGSPTHINKHIMVTLPLPAGIGITGIPNQYQRRAFECGIRYNILVVGQEGLGKTTFLQTLLGVPLTSLSYTNVGGNDGKNSTGMFVFVHYCL